MQNCKRNRTTVSTAGMSFVGYILGLGDRRGEHILFDLQAMTNVQHMEQRSKGYVSLNPILDGFL